MPSSTFLGPGTATSSLRAARSPAYSLATTSAVCRPGSGPGQGVDVMSRLTRVLGTAITDDRRHRGNRRRRERRPRPRCQRDHQEHGHQLRADGDHERGRSLPRPAAAPRALSRDRHHDGLRHARPGRDRPRGGADDQPAAHAQGVGRPGAGGGHGGGAARGDVAGRGREPHRRRRHPRAAQQRPQLPRLHQTDPGGEHRAGTGRRRAHHQRPEGHRQQHLRRRRGLQQPLLR